MSETSFRNQARVSPKGDVETWIDAVKDSASNVGPILGLPACEVLARIKTPPAGLSGMAVTLEGRTPLVRIGLLTNAAGRTAIARALFRMEETESPNELDERDAIGELTNVISGHVKAVMSPVDATMRIGLPSQVNADAFAGATEQITLRVSFGGVAAALVVTMLTSA
jgi:CheY-specific phosphatase CheX